MLTNDTLLLETAHHPINSSKLINKAPKCTVESFQLLLGAIDFINDNGTMSGQETFPKLLMHDVIQTTNNNNTTTEHHSNSNSIEEDDVAPSLTISDDSEDKSSEDEPSVPPVTTTPKPKSNSTSKHSNNNNSFKSRGGHLHNRDDSELICSCCKRDSSAVSFLKNYSIHSGNIDNYRNTFPDYDVIPGISCMTCYHKSWRYSKGLYDPNKARGSATNKREGIQGKSPSPSSSTTSTRKRPSPKRKNMNELDVATTSSSVDQDYSPSGGVVVKSSSKPPRKISKRRQNSSPSSTQSEQQQDDFTSSDQQPQSDSTDATENQSSLYSTSTYVEEDSTQGSSSSAAAAVAHHSLRLLLKFVWIEQSGGDDENHHSSGSEVYSCPIHLDFVPTTLTSIKSLVIGKLKTKLSGYECDSIVWCSNDQKQILLTDHELQQKALRNDDTLIVNVK